MARPELLINSPVPGKREPLATLAKALKNGDPTLELSQAMPEEGHGPGQTRLTIDNEIILVEATASTTVTILARKEEKSFEVEHSTEAKVFALPTVGAWAEILAEYATLVYLETTLGAYATLEDLGAYATLEDLGAYVLLTGAAGQTIAGAPGEGEGALILREWAESPAFVTINGTKTEFTGPILLQEADLTPVNVPLTESVTNNLALTTSSYYRLETTTEIELTGAVPVNPNQLVIFENATTSTGNIVLRLENEGSSAANRFKFSTGTRVPIAPGQSLTLLYDSAISRWVNVSIGELKTVSTVSFSGSQKNFSPAELAELYRASVEGNFNIWGWQYIGQQRITITNVSEVNTLTFVNESEEAEEQNRFKISTGQNLALAPLHTVEFGYDPTAKRWIDIALPAVAEQANTSKIEASAQNINPTIAAKSYRAEATEAKGASFGAETIGWVLGGFLSGAGLGAFSLINVGTHPIILRENKTELTAKTWAKQEQTKTKLTAGSKILKGIAKATGEKLVKGMTAAGTGIKAGSKILKVEANFEEVEIDNAVEAGKTGEVTVKFTKAPITGLPSTQQLSKIDSIVGTGFTELSGTKVESVLSATEVQPTVEATVTGTATLTFAGGTASALNASKRFILGSGENLILEPNNIASFIYDNTEKRWRLLYPPAEFANTPTPSTVPGTVVVGAIGSVHKVIAGFTSPGAGERTFNVSHPFNTKAVQPMAQTNKEGEPYETTAIKSFKATTKSNVEVTLENAPAEGGIIWITVEG